MTQSTTTATPTIAAPIRSHRASRPRTYLPIQTAISLTAKLFNPNLKPFRPFRIPTPPSIRASQLPPPCAELDERPKRRVRRFMLWTDKVPPLRLVVLDPRKRGQLRRFNVFQIPSNPQPSRGIRTWNGDLRNLRPRPSPAIPALPRRLQERSAQPATSAVSTQARAGRSQGPALTAHPMNRPVLPRKRTEKPIPPTGASSTGTEGVDDPPKIGPPLQLASRTRRPPGDGPEKQVLPHGVVPSQAAGIKAPIATDPPGRPRLARPPTDRPVRQMSSMSASIATDPPTRPRLLRPPTDRPVRQMSPTGIVPAQAGGVIAPVQNVPLVQVGARVATPAASRAAPRFRSTPESRRAERAKLLQHRFVLENQAEKRWRIAMDFMVTKMLIYEAEHTASSLTDDKPVWTDPDPAVVMQWTSFMADIRKWGNIWPHIELAQKDLPEWEKIKPVKGLRQARQRVKEANRKREETKRVKAEKIRVAREAKAAAHNEGLASNGPLARGAGPTMVVPRKSSPVLRIVNPDPLQSPPLPRNHSHRSSQGPSRSGSASGSSSSHSEHLLTPTASNTAQSPKSLTPNDKITSGELRSLGLSPEIPEDIAHHLADMLMKFQAIGLDRAEKDRQADEGSARQIRRDEGRRRRKERRAHAELEVSVDSQSSDSDMTDGLTNGPVSEKGSQQSWMTGDLNMDEDTRAVPSGMGTDVGSAS